MRVCWLRAALALGIAACAPFSAGAAGSGADPVLDPLADFIRRSRPTLDVRARWENADQTHLSGSNATTLRIRLGLKTRRSLP